MTRDHLSHKYIKEEEEDKIGTLIKETIRTETGEVIGQVAEIQDSLDTGPGLSRITEEVIFEAILGDMVDRIAEGTIEIMTIDITITIEVGIGQDRGHSKGTTVAIELAVQVVVDLGQDSGASTNRDRIRCYNCREYDHFARDCPHL